MFLVKDKQPCCGSKTRRPALGVDVEPPVVRSANKCFRRRDYRVVCWSRGVGSGLGPRTTVHWPARSGGPPARRQIVIAPVFRDVRIIIGHGFVNTHQGLPNFF